MAKALIVIDYENEWIDKDSEYYVGDISKQIAKLNKLIKFCRLKKMLIIFIAHVDMNSKTEFVNGSKNVDIISTVDYRKGQDVLIKKNTISAFCKTQMETTLKKLKIDEVWVTGILTNLCVRSFISDAYDRDFNIVVITDTCVAFDKKTHDFTINDLKQTRPEIKFKIVNDII
jgi:nicotinamidase-related amidase